MTERVLGPTGSRSRTTRASLLLMALIGLVFGVMIGGGGVGTAAPGPSVDDYSQCTDGLVDGPAPDPIELGCTAWINGILNTNNSTYHEDQVTPQRAKISGLSLGDHTMVIRYLIKKADAHAYDSLATYNWTQTDAFADRCLGFKGQALTACNNATSGVPATTAIPDDPLPVPSACNDPADTSANTITANHQLDGQVFTMWGGTLDPLTDANYLPTSTDSEGVFRAIEISFTATSPTVYFYFGGHLAAGANTGNPSSPRGWGADCGAGSISGGPYHIKFDSLDDESVGQRDNQIMSGAVLLLPPLASDISTAPSSSTSFTVTLNDSLDVGVADADGTATFKLYGPFTSAPTSTSCIDSGTGANLLWSSGNITVDNTTGTATTNSTTGTGSKDVSPTTTSIYTWVVDYAGDATHSPPVLGDTSDCGEETSTVTPPADPVHVP